MRRHIAILMYSLGGGGAQRRTLTIASALADRGHRVDLVVVIPKGPLASEIPDNLRMIALRSAPAKLLGIKASRRFTMRLTIPALVRYLEESDPDLLLASANHINIMALRAQKKSTAQTALVLRISNTIEPRYVAKSRIEAMRRYYPGAHGIIAVSKSAADKLTEVVPSLSDRIRTVYNPVWHPGLDALAAEKVDHPWFKPDAPPVVLGAGRLSAQKDFPTLLRAFALAAKTRDLRLVILGGSTKKRRIADLQKLARELGIADRMDLPGFVNNPLAYMAKSAVFVLSSVYEGLPGVLIEAMATGCAVVSTDCPGGSREILDQGRYGPLVPCRDPEALSAAITNSIDQPPARADVQSRAKEYRISTAIDGYLEAFESAIARRDANRKC